MQDQPTNLPLGNEYNNDIPRLPVESEISSEYDATEDFGVNDNTNDIFYIDRNGEILVPDISQQDNRDELNISEISSIQDNVDDDYNSIPRYWEYSDDDINYEEEQDELILDPNPLSLSDIDHQNWSVTLLGKNRKKIFTKKYPISRRYNENIQLDGEHRCSICFCDYEKGESVRILSCSHGIKHHYHTSCIDKWFQTSCSCPTCRDKILNIPLPEWVTDHKYPTRIMHDLNLFQDSDEKNISVKIDTKNPIINIEKKNNNGDDISFSIAIPEKYPIQQPEIYNGEERNSGRKIEIPFKIWNPGFKLLDYINSL